MSNAALTLKLRDFLKNAQRVAVVGVGQRLRSDDAAGVLAAEELFKRFSGSDELPLNLSQKEFHAADRLLRIFIGAETPESLTGLLRRFEPSHVLFLDAARMGGEPGSIDLVPTSEIHGDEISSHNIPLSILGKFLQMDMGASSMLLGIEPLTIDLSVDAQLSEQVQLAVTRAAELLFDALQQ